MIEKFANRTAQVGIMGLGYVGLPLALTFQRAGFAVTGFDSDAAKTTQLNRGESYIKHIGSEAVGVAIDSGKLSATTDMTRLADMDAILICVPTPLTEKREPDLSYIESTGREIARHLRPEQLIVLESSTYPGTTEEVLLPILEASGVRCRAGALAAAAAAGTATVAHQPQRAYVAYSPEREDPGNRDYPTQTIPKLVGGIDAESGELAAALYAAALDKVVPVSTAKVAEMAKILENTYRCVNIALVNELKQLCLRMGIDIFEVIDAASTKPFGFHPFYPGPGLGGHCIPIDPFYLSWKAKEYDFTARFIELAGEINTEMPYKVVEAIMTGLNRQRKSLAGARVLILGVAYKKDIDDMRESPALKIISLLGKLGAEVTYHDPHCPRIEHGRQNDFAMTSVPFTPEAAADYDCVAIITAHTAFDAVAIARHANLLVDTRDSCRGIVSNKLVRC